MACSAKGLKGVVHSTGKYGHISIWQAQATVLLVYNKMPRCTLHYQNLSFPPQLLLISQKLQAPARAATALTRIKHTTP